MSLRIVLLLVFSLAAFTAFAAAPDVAVAVPVLKSVVARRAVIAEQNLDYMPIPLLRANASVVRAITDVAGKQARRALKPGEIIRSSDSNRPPLAAKGSTVTMLFEAPGMRLSAIGRALA